MCLKMQKWKSSALFTGQPYGRNNCFIVHTPLSFPQLVPFHAFFPLFFPHCAMCMPQFSAYTSFLLPFVVRGECLTFSLYDNHTVFWISGNINKEWTSEVKPLFLLPKGFKDIRHWFIRPSGHVSYIRWHFEWSVPRYKWRRRGKMWNGWFILTCPGVGVI